MGGTSPNHKTIRGNKKVIIPSNLKKKVGRAEAQASGGLVCTRNSITAV